MPGRPLTLLDLFGIDPGSADALGQAIDRWPRTRVQGWRGASADPDPSDFAELFTYLFDSLRFHNVRPGASADRVGTYAEVEVRNPSGGHRPPLVFSRLPQIEYRLENTVNPARLYVTQSTTGVELVIEALPVEIRLPNDLLGPLRTKKEQQKHPGGGPDVRLTPEFDPARSDSLEVVLRDIVDSSIRVFVRLRMTEELDFVIEPLVPISIGPCVFMSLPCRAVHDLQLLPSVDLAGDHETGEMALEWTRYLLRKAPLLGFGTLGARTLDLESTHYPLSWLVEKMNLRRDESEQVELVLEDVLVGAVGPFPWIVHGRFGVRRRVLVDDTPIEAFNHTLTPIQISAKGYRISIFRLLVALDDDATGLFNIDLSISREPAAGISNAATLSMDEDGLLQLGWQISENFPSLFRIANLDVHILAGRLGVSLPALSDEHGSTNPFEPFQFLVDIGFLSLEETPDSIEFRARSGKRIDGVLRNVGYDRGALSLGNLWIPEGVELRAFDTFKLAIDDVGWVTENNGARYFSVSGSIPISYWRDTGAGTSKESDGDGSSSDRTHNTADKEAAETKGGGLRFHRLRWRTSDTEDAPRVLVDGLTLAMHQGLTSFIGSGLFSERIVDGHEYKECRFVLEVRTSAFTKHFVLVAELMHGRVSGDDHNFTYGLLGLEAGPLPTGSGFTVHKGQLLLAANLAPELPPPDGHSEHMRLFRWYKANDSVFELPVDRRPRSWVAEDDALTVGFGLAVTPSATSTFRMDFVLLFSTAEAFTRILIAFEAYLLKSPKPIGFAAVEFETKSDKFGFSLGVSLGLDNLWASETPFDRLGLIQFTGSLYIGNQPRTVAIGHIDDVTTWPGFRFKLERLDATALIGGCYHYVEDLVNAFGFIAQAKGGVSAGIGAIQFYAEIGFRFGAFRNEASSSVLYLAAAAGLRLKLFFVFSFGVSARLDWDAVGPGPLWWRLAVEFRIDTPWWLPDINFRFQIDDGESEPDRLSVFSLPLSQATALEPGASQPAVLALPRLTGEGPEGTLVYSLNDIDSMTAPPLDETLLDELTPISVDSAIALDFNASLDDELTVGENTPRAASEQRSEKLACRYELVSLSVRRRPRYGAGASVWTSLLAPETTRLDSSMPGLGDDLQAVFSAMLTLRWDRNFTVGNALDPRRLLINSATPYSFITGDSRGDDVSVRAEPEWPCCGRRKSVAMWHELDYEQIPLGVRAPSMQRIPETSSTLHWLTPKSPVVTTVTLAPGSPHGARVPLANFRRGPIASITFDEPVAMTELFAYWVPEPTSSRISFEVYRGVRLVSQKLFRLNAPNSSNPIRFAVDEGFTSLVIRYRGNPDPAVPFFMFTRLRYLSVRERTDTWAREQKCDAQNDRVLGGGRLAWLPNHDYEVAITTRTELAEEGGGTQDTEVTQHALFRTKGLPGLNAADRVGEEVSAYVESSYPRDARTPHYRSEPVVIAFNERFNVLSPIDTSSIDPEVPETMQLLEWVLVAGRSGEGEEWTRLSHVSPDWLTEHRVTSIPLLPMVSQLVEGGFVSTTIRSAPTLDPLRLRYEQVLASPAGCNLEEPLVHHSQVLTHDAVEPGGDGAGLQQWESGAVLRVEMQRRHGPWIARPDFEPGDETAITGLTAAGEAAGWQVSNRTLEPFDNGGSTIRYGLLGDSDDRWQHAQVRVSIAGNQFVAGVAISVTADATGSIDRSIACLVDTHGPEPTLRIERRRDGVAETLEEKVISIADDGGSGVEVALHVTAFDDQVRATIGEVEIEVPREDHRFGRLALVAEPSAQFHTLYVEPINAYQIYMHTSQYVDFDAHIRSFRDLTELAVGTGADPTHTVEQLIDETDATRRIVMQAGGDSEGRQRLFEQWTSALGLPVRERTERVEISRLTTPSGTVGFLIESPEPLNVSFDVAITLMARDLFQAPTPFLPLPPERAFEGSGGSDSTGSSNPRLVADLTVADTVLTEVGDGGSSASDFGVGSVSILVGTDSVVSTDVSPPFRAVPARTVSNGLENRILLIPSDFTTGNAFDLPPGAYRLDFAIDRVRYRTSTPDDASNYRATVSLPIEW